MIVPVNQLNIDEAALIHAESWQESHRSFCTPAFMALHTRERQKEYLLNKINCGSRVYMLIEPEPAGVVSVTGSLIEDLYVLPEMQNRGYGTALLKYAITQCAGTPTLWILENNTNAERLYTRSKNRQDKRHYRKARGNRTETSGQITGPRVRKSKICNFKKQSLCFPSAGHSNSTLHTPH